MITSDRGRYGKRIAIGLLIMAGAVIGYLALRSPIVMVNRRDNASGRAEAADGLAVAQSLKEDTHRIGEASTPGVTLRVTFNGVPVAGAAVEICDWRGEGAVGSKLTTSEGGLAACSMNGEYLDVTASKQGVGRRALRLGRHAISLPCVEVQLRPSSIVEAVVIGGGGLAIPGAQVQISTAGIKPGAMVAPPLLLRRETGGNGIVEFEVDADAVYKLRARRSDSRMVSWERRLETVSGERHRVVLAMPGAFSVVGTVMDGDLIPVSGAEVCVQGAMSGLELPVGRAQSGADGSFRVDMPGPGTYLVVAHSGSLACSGVYEIGIDERGTSQPLAIRMLRGQSIRGIVVDESGLPVVRCTVKLDPITDGMTKRGFGVRFLIPSNSPETPLGVATIACETDSQGVFEAPDVWLLGEWRAIAWRQTGEGLWRGSSIVVPMGVSNAIRVARVHGNGTVTIRLEGDASAGERVEIKKVERCGAGFAELVPVAWEARVGDQVELVGLDIGRECGLVVRGMRVAAYVPPEEFWRVVESGKIILEPLCSVRCVIRDAGNRPVSGMGVYLERPGRILVRGLERKDTDPSGQAELQGLVAGDYVVYVYEGRKVVKTHSVSVRPGTTIVDLWLD